MVKRIEM